MIVELITIGDELLDGRRVDTNTAWLGRKFTAAGTPPRFRQTMTDRKEDIAKAFRMALDRSDFIVSTGGLGPTMDDLTFESLAYALDQELEYRPKIFEKIKARFEEKGYRCTESNRRQAYLPKGSKDLSNDVGTAPGCRVEVKKKVIFALPGVPREMQAMFERNVLPEFEKRTNTQIGSLERIYKFTGLAESLLEERIETCRLHDMEGASIRVAYTASFPQIDVTISLRPTGKNRAEDLIKESDQRIRAELGDHLIAVDDETLESRVVDELRKRNWSLAVAESLTGGLIASRIVSVPGSSDVLERGYVTYSNESKVSLLGVSSETLKKYGAVSEECAREMAAGARSRAGCDLAVATTGIAGPTGETPTKPVGLTYIAWSSLGQENVRRYQFTWDRNRNRMFAAMEALRGILRIAKEQESERK